LRLLRAWGTFSLLPLPVVSPIFPPRRKLLGVFPGGLHPPPWIDWILVVFLPWGRPLRALLGPSSISFDCSSMRPGFFEPPPFIFFFLQFLKLFDLAFFYKGQNFCGIDRASRVTLFAPLGPFKSVLSAQHPGCPRLTNTCVTNSVICRCPPFPHIKKVFLAWTLVTPRRVVIFITFHFCFAAPSLAFKPARPIPGRCVRKNQASTPLC